MKIIYNKQNEKICQICGNVISNKRSRRFCDSFCRMKSYKGRYNEKRNIWHKNKAQNIILGLSENNRVQCLDCGKWFIQLGSHVVQTHKYNSAREYKEFHDLERKKGIVPKWYHDEKSEDIKRNKEKVYKNLEKGKEFWFTIGDKRAGRYKRSHITIERLKKNHNKLKNHET